MLPWSWLWLVPENSLVPAEANFYSVAAEAEEKSLVDLSSVPSQDPGAEDKLQVGLALPPLALEPLLTSGEIQQTLLLQSLLSSPPGCELQRDGW